MLNNSGIKVSLRKDDQVQVIAGREKGKIGKILEVDRKSGRVVVEKINFVKRHVKPSQQNPHGGVIEKEASLHYSNVLLFCSKCRCGVRHGSQRVQNPGKEKKDDSKLVNRDKFMKIRICKKCGEAIA